MRRIIIIGLLALILSGATGFIGTIPVFAQEGEPTTSTEEEPESKTAQAAREQECPESTPLFPLKLGVPLGNVTEVSGLAEYINEGYRFGVGVVLIVAIVMVVWGGFRYLVGSGVGDVERGKEIIRDAIVGMLIVLAAYAILQTINPATTNLSPPAISNVGCEPLDLPEQLEEGRCNTDADCDGEERCVETRYVFNTHESDPGLKYAAVGTAGGAVLGGGLPGAIIGGAGGYVYGVFSNLGRTIKMCTDGRAGSPCGEDEHCTQSGTICIEDWTICSRETGNPARSPCDDDDQCESGNCPGGTQRLCRGEAPILTHAVWRSVGYNLRSLAEQRPEYTCSRDHDCAEPGARCSGPGGHEVKFCVPGSAWVSAYLGLSEEYRSEEDQVELGSLCFLAENGLPLPTACSGAGGAPFVCLGCPASGARNWERLNRSADPELQRMGSCRRTSDIGERCAGGS